MLHAIFHAVSRGNSLQGAPTFCALPDLFDDDDDFEARPHLSLRERRKSYGEWQPSKPGEIAVDPERTRLFRRDYTTTVVDDAGIQRGVRARRRQL